jgi:hypothetical protein
MVHVPLMLLSYWRKFASTPCLAEKILDGISRLDDVEIVQVGLHAYFQALQKEKS